MLHLNYLNYLYKYIWKRYCWKGDIYGEEIYQTVWKKCQLYTDEKKNKLQKRTKFLKQGMSYLSERCGKRARGRKMEDCILLPAVRKEYSDKCRERSKNLILLFPHLLQPSSPSERTI